MTDHFRLHITAVLYRALRLPPGATYTGRVWADRGLAAAQFGQPAVVGVQRHIFDARAAGDLPDRGVNLADGKGLQGKHMIKGLEPLYASDLTWHATHVGAVLVSGRQWGGL